MDTADAISQTGRVHRLLNVSTRLAEPAQTIFARLYLAGEKESDIAADLGLSQPDFEEKRANLLRTLMIATS